MKVEITGKNIDITPAIRERIEAKFNKLKKWQVDVIGGHATVTKGPGKKHKVEANASIPGTQLVASAEHEDLFGAITEVSQKLERQLNKQQHKPESRRATHIDKPVLEEEDA
ncbi:ribosome-associated translation inhibitor RaiA [Vibrio sp. Of7-15]|uniref:ribosome hibernation-promoting factor, HPF/YfiA family n=1 Tax=Vibrio sp. Of7-15 TaxID=2724879 RepID=UPI001EF2B71C|nr:ribosome-associated translation inhibitor RaiA [Vibrio sp. Of7-15]MCG7499855.1 ribosome-associated translation inhibitor RaiA [Vibrio sp. Of7-15]